MKSILARSLSLVTASLVPQRDDQQQHSIASDGGVTSSLPDIPVVRVLVISLIAISIPFLTKNLSVKVSEHEWLYRAVWAVAFLVNCITVSIPGRFDTQLKDGKVEIPWRTLFEPSEWAFAIWGAIYLGELALTSYAAVIGQPSTALKDSSIYWLAGNLFQSLWCLSFRPAFKKILFFPAFFLASGSISLLLTFHSLHQHYHHLLAAKAPFVSDILPILLSCVPLALHATWLAGATLLNVNGWASVSQQPKPVQVGISFASAFIAAIVGITLSVVSRNPFFAWTSAWALTALGERSAKAQNKSFSDDVQQGLSTTELALARIAKIVGVVVSIISATKIVRPDVASHWKF
eukprot:gene9336-10138_t